MARLLSILFILAATITNTSAFAQNTMMVLDRAIEALNKAGGITARYTLAGQESAISGKVAMRGSRFAMLANEAKCWFDGKTQWAYSAMTGEVNITEPTQAELQMTNPLATLRAAKTEFIATRAKSDNHDTVTLRLTPKHRTNLRHVLLSFDNKTALPVKAVITTTDGQQATLTITDLKTRQRLPDSTFRFDKSLVPDATPVVDLR